MYDELLGDEAETRAVWAVLTGPWRVLAYAVLFAGAIAGGVAAAVGAAAGLAALELAVDNTAAAVAIGTVAGLAGAGIGSSAAWRAVRLLAAHRSPNGVLILATPTTSAQPSHVRVVPRAAADAQ